MPYRPSRWIQSISVAVTVAMFCLSLRPLSAAAAAPATRLAGAGVSRALLGSLPSAPTQAQSCLLTSMPRPAPTAEEQHSERLDALKELAKQARSGREVQALRARLEEAARTASALEDSFRAAEQELKAHGLPPVFLERHRAAVRKARAQQERLGQLARQVARADDTGDAKARAQAGAQVAAFFEKNAQGERHQPTPLSRLPFRQPEAQTRPPAASAAEFPAALTQPVASPDLKRGGAQSLTAALVPVPPDTLVATEDVQLTQPIQDLAAQLHHHPVEIYKWVHDNIEWVPTYGSIQGSDLTLLNRRGNAFDTASLLIALYRASGIPARYVYGTIELPAAQAMNWAGGVTRLEAAQQLLGQGGIPNVARAQGGALRALRMEHVWVEALVDFEPSRGAINHAPDTWVPVDASFKQYTFPPRTEVETEAPLDVETEAARIMATAVQDEATGSVTRLDTVAYDGWLDSILEEVNGRYGPRPTLRDFTGRRVILPEQGSVLAGALPYEVIARAQSFARLPDALRHRLQLTFYASAFDKMLGDPSLTWTVDLPTLMGKRLGVTYEPATAQDAAALAAYRAGPGSSLPLYLLNVRPVIQLDGVERARGPGSRMGEQQTWESRFLSPGDPGSEPESFEVTAGDEMVFGVNAQGVTEEMIHRRFQQGPSDTAAENLHTVALYYWAQYDTLSEAVAATRDALVVRMPSIGLFSSPLQVQYLFGIPRTGYYGSRQMDVARSLLAVVDRAGGGTAEVHRLTGTFGSLLEGRTFDVLFGREQGSGVSAVQLLRDANDQGIPIHLVTSANHAQVAPRLQLPEDIRQEIANAVLAGRQVLVSERAPLHGAWQGVGYIIEDPEKGTAAYLINGGLNGGADSPCEKERQKEPVRVPVLEIIFIIALVLALILLLLALPKLLALVGALGGRLALARVVALLGVGAAPTMAAAAPGQGMAPPGDCTKTQWKQLQVAVGVACKSKPFSCADFPDSGANCLELRVRRDQALLCASARGAINTTCFKGGDDVHKDLEMKAAASAATCQCKLVSNKCPL
ncbi:MAG TPA: transglutaminase domain-containing protein [Myxococcus sp.]|nr:transglutaminase domain-containing protein [Myxococcus sp.]